MDCPLDLPPRDSPLESTLLRPESGGGATAAGALSAAPPVRGLVLSRERIEGASLLRTVARRSPPADEPPERSKRGAGGGLFADPYLGAASLRIERDERPSVL
jgi:hypothetical protein